MTVTNTSGCKPGWVGIFALSTILKEGRFCWPRANWSAPMPLAAPIRQLIWDGVDYRTERTVLPANKANVLGMTIGNAIGEGSDTIVAFDQEDRLSIYNSAGGAFCIRVKTEPAAALCICWSRWKFSQPGGEKFRFYLPVRVRMADFNKDGKQEMIVPQNIDKAGRYFAQERSLKKQA